MASARPLVTFTLIVILLAGCTGQPLPASPTAPPPAIATAIATVTPQPSATPLPTGTATPTSTPLPTATLTPTQYLPASAGTPAPEPAEKISPDTTQHLQLLARWGGGAVAELDWLPDGGWLAVKTYSMTYLFRGGDLNQAPHLIEGNIVFGPADLLAAYSMDGMIQVWSMATWKMIYSLKGTRPAFSPDGKLLAALDGENVPVIHAADGAPAATLRLAGADRLYFSPDSSLLVASSRSEVHVWQSTDFNPAFSKIAGRILRSSFSKDGSLFFVQSRDLQGATSLGIWQVKDWSSTGVIQAGGTYVIQPDGKQAFIYSNFPTAGQVTVYSLPGGKQAAQFRADGSIYRLVVAPDSKTLALSLPDPQAGALALYAVNGKLIKKVFCEHSCDAGLPIFSEDGSQVYIIGHVPTTGLEVGIVALYTSASGGLVRVLRSPQNVASQVDYLALAPGGSQVAVYAGGADAMLYVWGAAAKPASSLDWGAQTLMLGNLSPDDSRAAVFNDRATVKVLRLADGSEVRHYDHATQPLFSNGSLLLTTDLQSGRFAALHLWQASSGASDLIFSPDITPPLVFSGKDDLVAEAKAGVVRFLQLPSGKLVSSFKATLKTEVQLNGIAFSPDGTLVAAGDSSGGAWLWRVSDGQIVFSFAGSGNPLMGLAFSPVGGFVAAAAEDGSLVVRRTSDGQSAVSLNLAAVLKAVLGEDETFNSLGGLAYSPDGKLIAVSGMLNPLLPLPNRAPVVVLLQASDGKLLKILHGGGGRVAFTADGMKLVASGDGTVQVWGVFP